MVNTWYEDLKMVLKWVVNFTIPLLRREPQYENGKIKRRNNYENVDGRNFYSYSAVWADVFDSSRYIKFINYRKSLSILRKEGKVVQR